MIQRIAGRSDCGECGTPFKTFETVHYLVIDNNSFCSECRNKLDPRGRSEWISSLYVGRSEEGRANILQVIKLWNESLDKYDYELRIDVDK